MHKNCSATQLEQLKKHLHVQALNHFDRIEILKSTESTNLLAADWIRRQKSPCVFVAEEQTSGRGRRGKQWKSPGGQGLYFSFSQHFDGSVNVEGLSLVMGLVVRSVLQKLTTNVALKWPNDVYVQQKKMAGILIEVIEYSKMSIQLVIGIGINLHLSEGERMGIDQPCIDLYELGVTCQKEQLLADILNAALPALDEFGRTGLYGFMEQWQEADITLGKVVNLAAAGNVSITGLSLGINAQGALMLKTNQGVVAYQSGDVSLRMVE